MAASVPVTAPAIEAKRPEHRIAMTPGAPGIPVETLKNTELTPLQLTALLSTAANTMHAYPAVTASTGAPHFATAGWSGSGPAFATRSSASSGERSETVMAMSSAAPLPPANPATTPADALWAAHEADMVNSALLTLLAAKNTPPAPELSAPTKGVVDLMLASPKLWNSALGSLSAEEAMDVIKRLRLLGVQVFDVRDLGRMLIVTVGMETLRLLSLTGRAP